MPKDITKSKVELFSSSKSPKKLPAAGQSTLNSFFAKPPSSSKLASISKGKSKAKALKDDDVIDLVSDDEIAVRAETDEEMAVRLGREELEAAGKGGAGKKRKVEVVEDDLPVASSSVGPSHSVKKKEDSVSAAPPKKKAFPMFNKAGSSSTPSPTALPSASPSPSKPSPSKKAAPSTLTAPLPLPVYSDLDVDPLLFDPASVDVSSWPGGRVTYAFLVESGFVKISATKKRLVIGRILAK